MEDKLNELKVFFESLPEDSPIGKSLQNLVNEVKRVADTATKEQNQGTTTSSDPSTSEEKTGDQPDGNDANETMKNDGDGSDVTTDDTKGSDATTDDNDTDDTTPEWMNALEDLMMDKEFITASAGFVLGAVTVGLGITLISALRK